MWKNTFSFETFQTHEIISIIVHSTLLSGAATSLFGPIQFLAGPSEYAEASVNWLVAIHQILPILLPNGPTLKHFRINSYI